MQDAKLRNCTETLNYSKIRKAPACEITVKYHIFPFSNFDLKQKKINCKCVLFFQLAIY